MTPERAQEIVAYLSDIADSAGALELDEDELPTIIELCRIGANAAVDLAHMREQAGRDSCADYAIRNRELEAALQREIALVNRIIRECDLEPPPNLQTGDTWDIAQSIIDRMARLREYTQHTPECELSWSGALLAPVCTCGLAELLAAEG